MRWRSCVNSSTIRISSTPSPLTTYRIPSHHHQRYMMGYCNGQGVKNSDKIIDGVAAVIRDRPSLNHKLSSVRAAGPSNLQVIADFDATLTKYWINGRRGQSSHGLLQQENPEYDKKRDELYAYYHPLEYSPTLPLDEKTKLMEEWWGKTHALLIEGGLTYDAIKRSVENAFIDFRDGMVELFEYLEAKDVPVLIFSAGLADIIEEVLRQKLHKSFQNVRVVSNRMVFDDDGHLVAFKGKTIHVLNKNEHALDMAAPLHDHLGDLDGPSNSSSVKKRTNVLLLGDHIGDLGMSDGSDYENRIAVGFLNDNIEQSLETYREAFDIVFLVIHCPKYLKHESSFLSLFYCIFHFGLQNDASMWGVVDLVSQLLPPSE